MHLLDANVLIDANRDYYPLARVREFWEWLVHHGAEGRIKIPTEILKEIQAGSDDLATWSKDVTVVRALDLSEESDPAMVTQVVERGYAADLTDVEYEAIGKDPFLIAAAVVEPARRIVVTTESSRPTRVRHNRHIPDVCSTFGIQCINTYELVRALDFRTDWRR